MASEHANEIRRALSDPFHVCERLGLTKDSQRQAGGLLVRCPHHRERTPSCSVTRGPDGTLRARCFGCDWSADALGLIAEVHQLDTGSQFREVLALGAELAGLWQIVEELRGSPVPPEHRNAAAPPPAQGAPPPAREFPPIEEVKALWEAARPVNDDAEACAMLRQRGIDAAAVDGARLARVLQPGQPLPSWARFRGQSWLETGHRLIVRVFDAAGALRSVRAWRVTNGDGPKRLPPSGHLATALVLANGGGFAVLNGNGEPDELVIQEGEPDFVVASSRWGLPTLGIMSGSWTPEIAERVAKAKRVIVRTHNDDAGDKYAAAIIESLKGKTEVWRRAGGREDDNDLLLAGKLPKDPKDDAQLVFNRDGSEPIRVLSVKQVLDAGRTSARKAGSLKSCTTGLREIDEVTGGLRPGFSWLFMADTNWGKSTWLVMVADENLRRGKKCLIVSAEDDEEIYGARLLARRARVSAKAIRTGRISAEDEEAMAQTIEAAESLPVYLDARGKSAEWVARETDRLIDEHDIDIVFFDYLQEMVSEKPLRNEVLDAEARARLLRHTVKSKKRASVIFSQITIDQKKQYIDKNSARGARGISHGADVILCGSTALEDIELKRIKDGYEETWKVIRKGAKFLKLDKIKNAPNPYFVQLGWDDHTASFVSDLAEPEPDFGGFDDATPDNFGGY